MPSSAGIAGYFTDVPYTAEHYEHLAPAWMNYVAALGGFRPRPAKRTFTYCELGCGHGRSTVILAAANPQARFVGVDINPEHVAAARSLAARCGVENAVFLEMGIGQALRKPLPPFDFVAAHGIWTWVGEAVRGQIMTFIERHLKPGGILTMSYNALPGCAAELPVRQMMTAFGEHKGGTTAERLQHGLTYLKFMMDNRAAFLDGHPGVHARVEEILGSDPRYLAHEYLTPGWKPEYFADLSRRMGEAGLRFAGAWPVADNYVDILVPERFRRFFDTAPSREVLESHLDFVRNTRFRVDYYVKTKGARTPDPWGAGLLDGAVFVPLTLPEELKTEFRAGAMKVAVQASLAEPLRAVLAAGPATLRQMELLPSLAGLPPGELVRGVQYLVLARAAIPGMRRVAPSRQHGISPANRVLLSEAAAAGHDHVVLASTATATGLPLRTAEALAYAGLLGGGRSGARDWCEALASKAPNRAGLLGSVDPLFSGISDRHLEMARALGL